MRPQTRPFTVEIKSKRRATTAASLQQEWLDLIAPDNLPRLDAHEDLPLASSHDKALHEAAKVLGPFGGGAQSEARGEPSTPLLGTDPEAHGRRVLPDLVAAAREQERINVLTPERPKQRRASNGSTSKEGHKSSEDQELRVRIDDPAPMTEQLSSATPAAPSAPPVNGGTNYTASRRPRGERWKERRLPRICWDRARRH
jgi:hypothetical protein